MGSILYPLSLLLRILGRPAFLIYCFLLVEGFVHTRDRKKYGRNLLLFGLISEIPFNLAVANRVFDPMYQNVFFELFIGFFNPLLDRTGGEEDIWTKGNGSGLSVHLYRLRSCGPCRSGL